MRLLNNIDRSARRLEALVSDSLDLARLESGRVKLARTVLDLREVVQAAAATMRPILQQKSQTLEVRVPEAMCPTLGDRQRLEQILLNLLSNANKYTDEGGRIAIRLEPLDGLARPQDGEEVVAGPAASGRGWQLMVEDNGTGIPPDEQKHIFERFYRAEDDDVRRTLGTGLGLSIAQALVKLHGGQIWLESRPGVGSKFYVSVPDYLESEASDDT